MTKIRKGDEVIVIAGKDKGKRGTILSMQKNCDKIVVEGINMVKKHIKANPGDNTPGRIEDKPMPIHKSNVKIYDSFSKTGSRVGKRKLEDGRYVRYFKKSDQLIDATA